MPCQKLSTTSYLEKEILCTSYVRNCQMTLDLRAQKILNFRKNSKLDGVEILVIAVKNYKKPDMKVLRFCQTLLHCFYLFFIFGHDCRQHASLSLKLLKNINSSSFHLWFCINAFTFLQMLTPEKTKIITFLSGPV